MKTIKQKPGRMRRAVRSVAVLLCVLAAYVVLSDMKLTPRAAIRMGEQYYGIYEPTHTVAMQRMRIGWQKLPRLFDGGRELALLRRGTADSLRLGHHFYGRCDLLCGWGKRACRQLVPGLAQ